MDEAGHTSRLHMPASSFSHLSLPPLPPPRHCRTTTPSQTAISRASTLSPVSRPLAEIEKSGVIACLHANDGNLAVEAARAALDGRVTCLEIVMSTAEDARKAVDVGAKFLMSPGTVMEILLGDDSIYSRGNDTY